MSLLGATALAAALIPDSVPVPRGASAGRLREGLMQPPVIALMLGGFMMSVAHAPLYTFLSIHLVEHGYGKTAIGGLWSLGVLAEVMVFATVPRLMALTSLRNLLTICFALAALRFALVGWAAAFPIVILFAQLLHGASFGAHHAASVTALNRWFAPHQQGTIQALFGSVSFGAGGVVGVVLSGYSWSAYGAGITFTGAAVAALAGLLLIWFGIDDREGAKSRSGSGAMP